MVRLLKKYLCSEKRTEDVDNLQVKCKGQLEEDGKFRDSPSGEEPRNLEGCSQKSQDWSTVCPGGEPTRGQTLEAIFESAGGEAGRKPDCMAVRVGGQGTIVTQTLGPAVQGRKSQQG